jgi:glycosyltransferase involved in cell wall biosynthesis
LETPPAYAVVTPAKNEAANLPRLAEALLAQTWRPETWLIVDDGSTDRTVSVARSLEAEHPWIRCVEYEGVVTSAAAPKRGAPVVRSFQYGLTQLRTKPEVIAKVDADTSMGPSYFAHLADAFAREPDLGVASGSCLELHGDEWKRRQVTSTHVWGAARAYRSRCLEQLLPLEERMGWDGIDVIKANVLGWTTRTFQDLVFRHHRVESAREQSSWSAWSLQGEASHYVGYRPSYVLARTVHQMRHDPAALAIACAYLVASLRRSPTCPDPGVRTYVRRTQRLRHLPERWKEASG